MTDVMTLNRVFEHAKEAEKIMPAMSMRFFTALAGSQNYGLSDEHSDVDTKTLFVPSFQNCILNPQPYAKTFVYENADIVNPLGHCAEEHINLADVRHMFLSYKKQNVNFLETLFTPYVDINPACKQFYQELYDAREDIAHYNMAQQFHVLRGHFREKQMKYTRACENTELYGYDPKQVALAMYLKDFVVRLFLKGESYENCLRAANPSELIAIKRGSLSAEEAHMVMDELAKEMDSLTEMIQPKIENVIPNPAVDNLLEKLTLELFATSFKSGGFYA